MRITILGASGLLGRALGQRWTGDEISGFSSKDADIRNIQQVDALLEHSRPEWIVLAAAYTDVDGCESNPELASAVNSRGAVDVAQAAGRAGAKLLLVSTDYVFDGAKPSSYEVSDPRNPINVYGRSKAEAEVGILQVLPNACIVRTSWLFGVGGKCFPDTILRAASTRPQIEVVADQRGCPTYSIDLAETIIQLCRRDARGIVHATNSGACSWFEFAEEIIRAAGLKTGVLPILSDNFPRPARRPANSVLSAASLHGYGLRMPDWKHALPRYLVERQNSAKKKLREDE
jgi:dTDP-4-dehydrorhamnose reductase